MCDKVHGAGSQASAKAQRDWSCAYKEKAGILQNETVWANAAKMPPEAWHQMYVKPWHPELARVGMRVRSQVISVSACERLFTGTCTQRSAPGLILQPLRSLSIFTQTANSWHQLAMLTSSRCLLRTIKMLKFCTAGLLRQGGPGKDRGADAPRRRVAHFGARREARVAAPRLGAPRPNLLLSARGAEARGQAQRLGAPWPTLMVGVILAGSGAPRLCATLVSAQFRTHIIR